MNKKGRKQQQQQQTESWQLANLQIHVLTYSRREKRTFPKRTFPKRIFPRGPFPRGLFTVLISQHRALHFCTCSTQCQGTRMNPFPFGRSVKARVVVLVATPTVSTQLPSLQQCPFSVICAHATRGTRPSFRTLYFCCLGKHDQTETGFETSFLPMKRDNSVTS